MVEHLADADADGDDRGFAARGQAFENGRVGREFRGAVHAQGLGRAGQQEDEADVRVVEDVGQAEDEFVARPVGHEQRVFVLYADEARAVALGRDVLIALRVRGGEQQKRRPANEVDARLVERRPQFVRHQVAGRADQFPELFPTGDAVRVCV